MSSNGSSCPEFPAHWRIVRPGEVYRCTTKSPLLQQVDLGKIPFVPVEVASILSNFFDYCVEGGDRTTDPRVTAVLEDDLEDYLACPDFPLAHRPRIGTANRQSG